MYEFNRVGNATRVCFEVARFACCIPKGFKPLAGGKLAPPPENEINPFDIPEGLQHSVAVIPPG